MSKTYRVFLASPGDVKTERGMLDRVVDEVNDTVGDVLDCRLEAVRWETHAIPDAGRPQQVINDQIGEYEIFVGVMWRRFGTPTGVAGSGTEEEFRVAYDRWEKNPRLALMFYFCQAPFYPANVDELEQMRQVLVFRKELDGKALTWTYDAHESFESMMRKHLGKRLKKLHEERGLTRGARSTPDEGSIEDLKELWPYMAPDLRRAISIAYNENRLAGDPGIQTRDLFAAMQRVGSPTLQQVLSDIPSQALPGPTEGPVSHEAYIVEERPWLSHCVASSIRRLRGALPPGQLLTSTDIFADIAKNGTGSSVALLRKHNVQPADIDTILQKKGIEVLSA